MSAQVGQRGHRGGGGGRPPSRTLGTPSGGPVRAARLETEVDAVAVAVGVVLALRVTEAVPIRDGVPSLGCPNSTGGGGISWGVYFAWEISCFKLTAKFATQILRVSAKFPTLVVGTAKFSSAPSAPLCSFTPVPFFFSVRNVGCRWGGGGHCTNRGLYACQCLLLPFPAAFQRKWHSVNGHCVSL